MDVTAYPMNVSTEFRPQAEGNRPVRCSIRGSFLAITI